ncbi:hypothetical protein [Aquimarina algiphila]|uniref:hypothetical protein n=1 Tax=Aquimarina algiphila TaxID=2047982 RepID=UPI00249197F5|nr:hypothetical protein [Aquimarina algiphila]
MAPLKFEEKIKEKLEQRAIKPSDNSWEQLAAQLDDIQHQKKGSKRVWWYTIAAIFVGVLVMTSIVMNQDPTSKQRDNQFVDNSEEIIKNDNVQVVLDNNTSEKSIKNNDKTVIENVDEEVIKENIKKEDIVVVNHSAIKNTSKSVEPIKSMSKAIDDNPQYDVVKLAENDKGTTTIREEVLPIDSLIIEDKVANVIAQIQELQKNNAQVTDEEIDQLLLKAQREITTKKIFQPSNEVSASALLQDVENELDETFKQRVFEALKTGFEKVKTAVVERDN